MKPHVIYKMRRDFTPSAAERARYHPGVEVSFQPCGVIDQGEGNPAVDTEWMLDNYVKNWAKVHHTGRRLLVYDSAAAHLTTGVKDAIAATDTSLVVIPGGLTSVLQSLAQGTGNPVTDTDFIFVCRHHYQRIAFEWADKNPDVKLTRRRGASWARTSRLKRMRRHWGVWTSPARCLTAATFGRMMTVAISSSVLATCRDVDRASSVRAFRSPCTRSKSFQGGVIG